MFLFLTLFIDATLILFYSFILFFFSLSCLQCFIANMFEFFYFLIRNRRCCRQNNFKLVWIVVFLCSRIWYTTAHDTYVRVINISDVLGYLGIKQLCKKFRKNSNFHFSRSFILKRMYVNFQILPVNFSKSTFPWSRKWNKKRLECPKWDRKVEKSKENKNHENAHWSNWTLTDWHFLVLFCS